MLPSCFGADASTNEWELKIIFIFFCDACKIGKNENYFPSFRARPPDVSSGKFSGLRWCSFLAPAYETRESWWRRQAKYEGSRVDVIPSSLYHKVTTTLYEATNTRIVQQPYTTFSSLIFLSRNFFFLFNFPTDVIKYGDSIT